MSSSSTKANINILVYLNIQLLYIINIFLYIVWLYIILSVKFLNPNNNTVLIFGGYLVFILVPISQKLIKLMSGIFLLGLHQPQAFFYLLLFWLCFHISLGVCVCECLIIHTQPYFIYWVYLILDPSPIIHLSFVKCC